VEDIGHNKILDSVMSQDNLGCVGFCLCRSAGAARPPAAQGMHFFPALAARL